MKKCRCGKVKPHRYLVCKECFVKMSDNEKGIYRQKSRDDHAGTLRRWKNG